MKKLLTPTLALIIAGGLTAGIALARPAPSPAAAEPQQITATTQAGFLNAPSAEDRAPAVAAIEIADFGFGTPVTVAPGQTITVTNNDDAAHTVTADAGAFETGTIASGAQATFTAPTEPGVYPFFCAIHPSMLGELVVQG